jgi:hypothetical protein
VLQSLIVQLPLDGQPLANTLEVLDGANTCLDLPQFRFHHQDAPLCLVIPQLQTVLDIAFFKQLVITSLKFLMLVLLTTIFSRIIFIAKKTQQLAGPRHLAPVVLLQLLQQHKHLLFLLLK